MMDALVTVVITTYKRSPKMILRSLNSVRNQSYKNLEIIVVDDSPSDYEYRLDVEKTVRSCGDARVTYIPHNFSQGACVARNTGLDHANGEYIGFLDDDDEWLPEKIEKQLSAFHDEKTALVYCASITYDEQKNIETIWEVPNLQGRVYDRLILRNFVGSTSFPLMRTTALKSINGFDPLMQSAQDYDVWLRLAQQYEFNYVTEPLVRYYVHSGDQITKNPHKTINGLERINEKNCEYIKRHKKVYAIRILVILPYYLLAGLNKKAFAVWVTAVFNNPFAIRENIKGLGRLVKGVLGCYKYRSML